MLLSIFIYFYVYPLMFSFISTFLYEFYTKFVLDMDMNNEIGVQNMPMDFYNALIIGCFVPIINIIFCVRYIRTIINILI
jgi:hypothetical protein